MSDEVNQTPRKTYIEEDKKKVDRVMTVILPHITVTGGPGNG